MKKLKIVLSLVLCIAMLLSSLPISAFAVSNENDFSYAELPDGTITITKYNGSDTNVVIPDTINGKQVTAIGSYIFYVPPYNATSPVVSVDIPDGVTSIGYNAFATCLYLSSVILPISVKNIGEMCFYDLGSLKIRYCGSQERWSTISFGSNWATNTKLTVEYEYCRSSFELPDDCAGSILNIGDTFEMGMFPQTEVTDTKLLNKLNSITVTSHSYEYQYIDTDDNYIELDMNYADVIYGGQKYRKVSFTQYRPYWPFKEPDASYSSQDDNGYYIGNVYWFKWEPIVWKVLDVKSDGVYAISQCILDAMAYNTTDPDYSITWSSSTLKKWLNNIFLEAAFSDKEKQNINADICVLKQLISSSNRNSYTENYTNLGNRKATTTNYADSQGATCYYWLFDYGVMHNSFGSIAPNGTAGTSYCDRTDIGVRPVITIDLLTQITTSDLPNPNDDRVVKPAIKYGQNRLLFGENIVGGIGEEIKSLVVYTSETENIASLDIKSSNTDVVEIGTIEIGVGEYITSENEHKATIPLKLKAEGSSTITITSPEGVSESINVIVNEEPLPNEPEEPQINGFSAQRNGWNIINFNKSFGYSDDYKLPISSYYATDVTFSAVVNSILNREWGGSCFGLSLLAVAEYNNQVKLKNFFSKSGDTLNSYGYEAIINASLNNHSGNIYSLEGNDEIIKSIERAQASQYSSQIAKAEVFKWDSDYSDLLSYLNCENAAPLVITMNLGTNGGHAIVTDTSIKPIDCGNGRYAIMCYDSNSPQLTNQIDNQWDIYSYEQSYVMVDINNGRWWYYYNGETEGYMEYSFLHTRYIRFYDVSKLETDFFYGDSYSFEENCITNCFNSSDFSVLDKSSGEILFEVNNNTPVLYSEKGEYYPYCESGINEHKSTKGYITLPSSDYQFANFGESNLTLICDNYIVSYCVNDDAIVDFSNTNKSISINNVSDDTTLEFDMAIQNSEGDIVLSSSGCIETEATIMMSVDLDTFNPMAIVKTDSNVELVNTSLLYNNQIIGENFHQFVNINTLSGEVESFGVQEGNCILRLMDASGTIEEISTSSGNYTFENIPSGTYTLEVSKADHVTRTYSITVTDEDVAQDVKIHLIGDVTGDGKVNTIDVNRVYAHVRETNLLTGYELKCANVAGLGDTVNTIDVNRIYAHVKETNLLW